MRNVVLHMKMSVDGYIGDAEGGVDWVFPTVDEEVTDWILELLRNAGTHIMGHTLYDEMAAYWPHSAEPFCHTDERDAQGRLFGQPGRGHLGQHDGRPRRY